MILSGFHVLKVCAVALALSLPGFAAVIPADLDFTGEFRFDTGVSGVGGTASQSGTIFARVGGLDTTGAFTDGLVTSGPNPITATLTEHGGGVVGAGDGFGGTASAIVSLCCGGFLGDTDLGDQGQTTPLTITNSSGSLAYLITLSLTFDHSVDAGGADSYAESDLEVELEAVEFVERELISDTLLGNVKDDAPFPGFGGPLSDSGVFVFSIGVGPGAVREVGLDYTMEGAVFAAAGLPHASVSASYFLSVDNVTVIPEPGTLPLIGGGLGLLALGRLRWRRPGRT